MLSITVGAKNRCNSTKWLSSPNRVFIADRVKVKYGTKKGTKKQVLYITMGATKIIDYFMITEC